LAVSTIFCRNLPNYIQVLVRYARTQFINPSKSGKKIDLDHRLLLNASFPLLQSRNSAVVLSVASLYLDLAPEEELRTVVSPLVNLVTNDRRETKFLSLEVLSQLASTHPHLISPFVKHFFIFWSDGEPIARIKIKILVGLALGAPGTAHQVVRELETLSTWDKTGLATEAVRALGLIACAPDLANTTLPKLLLLLNDSRETVSGEAIVSVQKLIQHDAERNKAVIKKLARMFLNGKG
jgi:AP-3 complex subunit beta